MHRTRGICFAIAILLVFIVSSPAQIISTIAGNALYDRAPATQIPLNNPFGVAADDKGNFWIADTSTHVIRYVDGATGYSQIVAGGGTVIDAAGPIAATSAVLETPNVVVRDKAGNIYFCEWARNRVRKLAANGVLTTVAGTGQSGFSGDGGPATQAMLGSPQGLAVDQAGNLYISDTGNLRIRRVAASNGAITTIAGTGAIAMGGDGGPATAAAFLFPGALAIDSKGNIFVVDNFDSLRRINGASGIITTVLSGAFNTPGGLAIDGTDAVYASANSLILKLPSGSNQPQTITQTGGWYGGIAVEASGTLLVTDFGQGVVYRFNALTGANAIVAGSTDSFDGPLALTRLASGNGLASDRRNLLYTCEGVTNTVHKVDLVAGTISTLARDVCCSNVAVDSAGKVYATSYNQVRTIDPATGAQTIIAGTGASGSSGDGGPATQANMGNVNPVAVDAAGNVYLGDGTRIRRIDAATRVIRTIYTAAANVRSLAFDNSGNLLLGNEAGGLGRLNVANGQVSTIIPDGAGSTGDGGPASNARGVNVSSIVVNAAGDIILADPQISVVRRIDAVTGLIDTIAGTPWWKGYFGDGGPAKLARMWSPVGLALDGAENIYVVEQFGDKLRKITPVPATAIMSVSETALTFTAVQSGSPPDPQTFRVASSNLAPMTWSATVATVSGGTWLRVTPSSGPGGITVSVFVDPAGLAQGSYQGVVRVTGANGDGSAAVGSPKVINVTLNVGAPGNPALGVSSEFLSFSAVQGGAAPSPQVVSITNQGSGSLQWTAQVKTNNGGNWLNLSATSGTAPSFLSVTVSPASLAAGVYTGLITLQDGRGGVKTVSVTLIITKAVPIMQASQSGFLFQGIEGAASISAQTFQIFNLGQGSMGWSVRATTADGRNWLSVTPSSGSTDAGPSLAAPSLTLKVDSSQLRAGVYVGLLTFEAPAAPNSPQNGIVLVNMLAPGSDPLGLVQPAGLIFLGAAGGAQPAGQQLTLSSSGGKLLQFATAVRTSDGGNWLSVSPAAGSLSSAGDSAPLQVQANTRGLAAGIYTGTITVALNTGKSQDIAVALVVTAVAVPASDVAPASRRQGPEAAETAALPGAAAACTPRQTVLVETLLAGNFALAVSWPVALRAQLMDDCGQPVATAAVVASFTNGDPPLTLSNLKDGRYIGTWVPLTQARTMTVTLRATSPGLPEAKLQLQGSLTSAAGPLAFRNGAVNAASYTKFAPLAPGSIFSLFGRNLAAAPASASSVPLPRELGSVRVTLGGLGVPLFYADNGQLNAQAPYELAPGANASLVVTVGGIAAPPDEITITDAQPGIFTISQSGAGQGAILSADYQLVDSAHPVKAGDVIMVFCTGLGLTTPAAKSGEAAPSNPPAVVNSAVTATVGGVDAAVQWAGLTPGYVGLYQVNVQIPAGVSPGNAVPLVLKQSGVSSNTVTIAAK